MLLRFFSTFDMDKLRNIRRHHWKERLKISKTAMIESNLLKTNEDIAPQRCEILQTFVRWGGGGGGFKFSQIWGPPPPPPPPAQRFPTVRTYIFARLRRITFKPGMQFY